MTWAATQIQPKHNTNQNSPHPLAPPPAARKPTDRPPPHRPPAARLITDRATSNRRRRRDPRRHQALEVSRRRHAPFMFLCVSRRRHAPFVFLCVVCFCFVGGLKAPTLNACGRPRSRIARSADARRHVAARAGRARPHRAQPAEATSPRRGEAAAQAAKRGKRRGAGLPARHRGADTRRHTAARASRAPPPRAAGRSGVAAAGGGGGAGGLCRPERQHRGEALTCTPTASPAYSSTTTTGPRRHYCPSS